MGLVLAKERSSKYKPSLLISLYEIQLYVTLFTNLSTKLAPSFTNIRIAKEDLCAPGFLQACASELHEKCRIPVVWWRN